MSDFKSFLVDNGVIATTAGITIGWATASFVKSMVADVILPVIFLIIVKGSGIVSKEGSGFFGRFLSKKEFMFTNFISETITWIVIVLTAFFILNFFYVHYIQNKPLVSQETLAKPFNVTQELFRMSLPPPPPPPAPKHEFFNNNEDEEIHGQPLWGAPN